MTAPTPLGRPQTREQLVEALTVERYACNDWWTRRPAALDPLPALPLSATTDDDLTCARRRRDLDDEMRGVA